MFDKSSQAVANHGWFQIIHSQKVLSITQKHTLLVCISKIKHAKLSPNVRNDPLIHYYNSPILFLYHGHNEEFMFKLKCMLSNSFFRHVHGKDTQKQCMHAWMPVVRRHNHHKEQKQHTHTCRVQSKGLSTSIKFFAHICQGIAYFLFKLIFYLPSIRK